MVWDPGTQGPRDPGTQGPRGYSGGEGTWPSKKRTETAWHGQRVGLYTEFLEDGHQSIDRS